MRRTILAAAMLTSAPALALAQSASTPLIVTATVVSSCRVEAPPAAEASSFATMSVSVTCTKGRAAPRVQRPIALRRGEVRDAVLIIDF